MSRTETPQHAEIVAGLTGADFFALAESAPEFVAVARADNEVLYVNPAGRALVGLDSLAEARSHPIADYLDGEGRRASFEVEQPAAVRDGFWQGRSTLRHFRTGESIPVQIASFPVADANGEVRLLATFQRDIREELHGQRLLEAAFDHALVGMMMADPTGRFTRANDAACRLLGYTEAELRELDVVQLSHPDDRAQSHEHLARLAAGELSTFEVEKRYLRKDGTPVWVQLGATAVRRQDGSIEFFISQVQDISERHAAQEALRESEERFRRLVENAQDLVLRIRLVPELGYDYVSPSAWPMFGYAPEEFYARPELALETIHPDDVRRLEEAYARNPEEPITVRAVRRDGSVVWIERRQIVVRDDDGTPVALEAIVRDVTERVERAAALARRERQLQAVFDGALDAMLIVDDERRYVAANPAAAELFGLTVEQILGRRIEELLGGPPDIVERWASFLAAGDDAGEMGLRRPDGAERRVEYRSRARIEPGRHLSVMRDVTEQRRAEERLRQVDKLEAIGRLAAGVAHDFNNLLTVIDGYRELALDELAGVDSVAASRIVEIRRAGESAAALTRQLLAFGRKQLLQPELIDLNALVGDHHDMLARLLGDDVAVAVELDERLAPVRADPSQIAQVLLNLAVNARDAMPDGGTLRIVTRNDPDAGEVTLTVADTGPGIDPAVRPRLFEPFFTTKPPGQGTGLGLATVLGVVEQSGGSVDVADGSDAGAAFTVRLPRAEGIGSGASADRARAPVAGGSERILLVEDNDAVRPLVDEFLRSLGYEVVAAATPAAALAAAAESGEVDLLVTDVVMPGMHGHELARQLRERRPALRVLFVSGYASDVIASRGALPVGADFLQKPFTLPQLARRARAVLDAPAGVDG
jgi:PAS domain S-box-containing protein